MRMRLRLVNWMHLPDCRPFSVSGGLRGSSAQREDQCHVCCVRLDGPSCSPEPPLHLLTSLHVYNVGAHGELYGLQILAQFHPFQLSTIQVRACRLLAHRALTSTIVLIYTFC